MRTRAAIKALRSIVESPFGAFSPRDSRCPKSFLRAAKRDGKVRLSSPTRYVIVVVGE
jgi:hypothetical protein